jgi:hypothetical protein
MNTDSKQWPDLASRAPGAGVIYANDEPAARESFRLGSDSSI